MTKILKSGINKAIVCKNCGKKVGFVRMKSKLKWRTIRWALTIAFIFEFVANAIIYIIFEKI